MIRFIKREWFKLSIVTILSVTSLSLITNVSEAGSELKITKSRIKTLIERVDGGNYTTKNALSIEALANIEYLKLEQLEQINKELKKFNENYKLLSSFRYDPNGYLKNKLK